MRSLVFNGVRIKGLFLTSKIGGGDAESPGEFTGAVDAIIKENDGVVVLNSLCSSDLDWLDKFVGNFLLIRFREGDVE